MVQHKHNDHPSRSGRQLAERKGESIPGVYGVDQQCEIDEFGRREMRSHPFPDILELMVMKLFMTIAILLIKD